jgi:septum formation protein
MLAELRGRWHQVTTGVAVYRGSASRMRHITTRVKMRTYTVADIDAYIARREPFDKAGGYAIQDAEFRPVEVWHGCYCNTVGLPLWRVRDLLGEAGLPTASLAIAFPPPCLLCPHAPEEPLPGPC